MSEPSNDLKVNTPLLEATRNFVYQFFQDRIDNNYIFHDLDHTKNVVQSAIEVAGGYNLPDRDLEIVQLAAWFHDLGYDQGPADHEARSAAYAQSFLEEHNYPKENLELVLSCIRATKVPQQPKTLLEQILCDADLSHLGKETYWDRCGRIRQELLVTQNNIMSEQEWVEFELNFMLQHNYHTHIAGELYDVQKLKHIRQLYKQKARLNPNADEPIEIPPKPDKKKKKKKRNSKNDLGRGVETMYRTTYRTHVNLSSIADNKANIMLSINAIIVSIVVSNLVPQLDEDTRLIFPTILLLAVCLAALVFAILSTRPKITEGKFTREDIKEKRSNLLFFGNFYNMELDDFHWGMMEMIKDSDFLYSSMTRDLYYLGVVLAKKYKFLRICYSIFMYGLIVAVITFGLSYLI
jgi:predicted metal-dependent HD superfamily phosphohydrolase